MSMEQFWKEREESINKQPSAENSEESQERKEEPQSREEEMSERAEFEEAQKHIEELAEDKKAQKISQGLRSFGPMPFGALYNPVENLAMKIKESLAERKIEKIIGKSQEEAEKLNEEYEQLKKNIIDDIEALRTFEKEKLGMQVEDNKERN
jgi:hypothetical protein